MTTRGALTVAVQLLVLGAVVPAVQAAGDGWTPPGDTITAVAGTARHGFRVDHYDGSTAYLPTRSEALTECSEYDAAPDRLRCRVKVRTGYDALGDIKRALRLAHAG